jgi:hypothetical protein
MYGISFATGPAAYVPGIEPLGDPAFGARYVSFDQVARFLDQTEGMNLGLIAWPGGHLAEFRTDRYGLEHDGLYAGWTGKPGIAEMMEIAIARDAALAVTIPTIRYFGREAALETELDAFLQSLLGGAYGPLPDELILQVGSEFFNYFEGPDAAADYGRLAALTVNTICRALSDPDVNTIGADLRIAVQMGRTLAEDELVRSGMCEPSLSRVSYLVHNHFTYQPDNADREIGEIVASLERWDEVNRAAGGDGTRFFFAAYNIGHWTREGVRAEWLDLQEDGLPVTEDDVDLAARTNADFERFWQQRLSEGAFGLEHATVLIELFSVHAELGATKKSVFGIDFTHPGRLTWREDGQDYLFAGGGMVKMLYESIRDTVPLGSEEPYHKDNPVTAWGFENDDKLVVFLAAGQRPPGEVTLDIEGLGSTYRAVFADGLTARVRPDWMEVFGIPDHPDVDETPEAQTYAEAVRAPVEVGQTGGGITVSLGSPFEIVRLAFARTDAGFADIASWSESGALLLDLLAPDMPGDTLPDEPPPDDGDDADDDDGGEGGMAGLGLLLLAALPLLLLA